MEGEATSLQRMYRSGFMGLGAGLLVAMIVGRNRGPTYVNSVTLAGVGSVVALLALGQMRQDDILDNHVHSMVHRHDHTQEGHGIDRINTTSRDYLAGIGGWY